MLSALSNAKLRATIHHTKTIFLQYHSYVKQTLLFIVNGLNPGVSVVRVV